AGALEAEAAAAGDVAGGVGGGAGVLLGEGGAPVEDEGVAGFVADVAAADVEVLAVVHPDAAEEDGDVAVGEVGEAGDGVVGHGPAEEVVGSDVAEAEVAGGLVEVAGVELVDAFGEVPHDGHLGAGVLVVVEFGLEFVLSCVSQGHGLSPGGFDRIEADEPSSLLVPDLRDQSIYRAARGLTSPSRPSSLCRTQ
ncbi:hypothetical protein ADL26_04355, partial [Thermoactinomyces vulgaris]